MVLDVDGVLTDGSITVDGRGGEWKTFDVKDGQGLALARAEGLKVVFLTGRRSEAVALRATELSIDRVYQGARDKAAVMKELFSELDISGNEVAYLGDDLPDIAAMRMVALPAAVGDAVPEVAAAADWISKKPGGRGAVRELVEFILRSQGRWGRAVERAGG